MGDSLERDSGERHIQEIIKELSEVADHPVGNISAYVRARIEKITKFIEQGADLGGRKLEDKIFGITHPISMKFDAAADLFEEDRKEIVGIFRTLEAFAEQVSRKKNPERWDAWDKAIQSMAEESIEENRFFRAEIEQEIQEEFEIQLPIADLTHFQITHPENVRELLTAIYSQFWLADIGEELADVFTRVDVLERLNYALDYLQDAGNISSTQHQQACDFIGRCLRGQEQF